MYNGFYGENPINALLLPFVIRHFSFSLFFSVYSLLCQSFSFHFFSWILTDSKLFSTFYLSICICSTIPQYGIYIEKAEKVYFKNFSEAVNIYYSLLQKFLLFEGETMYRIFLLVCILTKH